MSETLPLAAILRDSTPMSAPLVTTVSVLPNPPSPPTAGQEAEASACAPNRLGGRSPCLASLLRFGLLVLEQGEQGLVANNVQQEIGSIVLLTNCLTQCCPKATHAWVV